MAVRTVRQSAANAADGSLLWELAGIVNALAARANGLVGDGLLGVVGLAIGTSSAAAIKFANDIRWSIGGVTYRIAAGEVAFTATTHDIADPDADGREAIYVLSVPAAATAPTITKGTTAALLAAVAPATPAGHVKIGEVKVAHNGSAIFDASTDLLSAAHLTDTYTDEPATAGLSGTIDTVTTPEGGTPS